ncbi:hypothetical protein IFVP136_C230464 [Vibrio parahaemolyticus]
MSLNEVSSLAGADQKALAKYFVKRLDICLDNRKLQKSPKRYQLTVTEPKNIRPLMID